MVGNWVFLILGFVVLFSGVSPASASPPSKIASTVFSSVVSALFKRLWSLNSSSKKIRLMGFPGLTFSAFPDRLMMKFESGYSVETVFDGSKLGIEPFSVQVSSIGELLILDSENSNLYEISLPVSRFSRPKLIAGSPEGYPGHVDGRLREARMNKPKGITVDGRGNIYIADTMNMAIRKISDLGVTTIAGGKWNEGTGPTGHVDGRSEDAKFSDDFTLVYSASSCSLLIVDRGKMAIREIQLKNEDCNHDEYGGEFHLGIVMLIVAGVLGYLVALLQRKVQALFSWQKDSKKPVTMKGTPQAAAYRRAPRSIRPPLIPSEDEPEKPEQGFFTRSIRKLFLNADSSMAAPYKVPNPWPPQESFEIAQEDGPPPSLETRKTYPFMSNDLNVSRHFHRQVKCSSTPETYYEERCEGNEILFGAVQEQGGRREAVVIKAVDHGDSRHNLRPRFNYSSYSHGR